MHDGTFCYLYIVINIAGDKICRDEPGPLLPPALFLGETVKEGVYRSILFLTKKLHLILF